MSKENPIVINYEDRIIEITGTVTIKELVYLIKPLADFERKNAEWPNVDDIDWEVIVKE